MKNTSMGKPNLTKQDAKKTSKPSASAPKASPKNDPFAPKGRSKGQK